ncbi:DUF455 family protein [Candidatus Neptunochlamydia vexilliferae]|uniref:DUF455 domain-containing protein n=1 Tax=Candidatus Neptunichlamydia vexilliferae TaxID=1651774 RepID=A0ABS0AYY0_9BACT|nr:DUF455 family protein [Candidatus Neptunochlamydia vexilliferae]MBF5058822.1 hypothetical protein [Candidatus Neptunochlamydia vexilliferae]
MAYSPVEMREWAVRILSADTLEEKLFSPDHLTDNEPGPPMIWNEPTRPPGMQFQRRKREGKLPPFQAHHDPNNRAACLHRFAGHELLAVEIMAYALLRFPEAPAHFRKGLAHTLKEEQEHVRLYMKELSRLGVQFGDLPLFKHFWCHTPYLTSPLSYVSVMSLTFEMANLDFAPMYGASFEKSGDKEAAALMARILKDEIAHVSFGWRWLQKFKKKELSEWDAWAEAQSPLLSPKRARGFLIHEEHRRKAGVSKAWIEQLKTQ